MVGGRSYLAPSQPLPRRRRAARVLRRRAHRKWAIQSDGRHRRGARGRYHHLRPCSLRPAASLCSRSIPRRPPFTRPATRRSPRSSERRLGSVAAWYRSSSSARPRLAPSRSPPPRSICQPRSHSAGQTGGSWQGPIEPKWRASRVRWPPPRSRGRPVAVVGEFRWGRGLANWYDVARRRIWRLRRLDPEPTTAAGPSPIHHETAPNTDLALITLPPDNHSSVAVDFHPALSSETRLLVLAAAITVRRAYSL